MKRYGIAGAGAAGTLALVVFLQTTGVDAQSQPQGSPQAGNGMGSMNFQPAGLPEKRTVHITGENPGLQLRDKENGPITADFNFWRVHWSPVGVGHVCYMTTGTGTGPNDIRVVLTDNEKLVDYVSNQTMAKLVPNFNTPPYKVIKATFKTTGDTLTERSEHCISDQYKIVATWRKITPGRFGGMDPNNGFFMNFIIHMAAEGEITVNGKRLPGAVLPGPGRPPSYLAFAETWLK